MPSIWLPGLAHGAGATRTDGSPIWQELGELQDNLYEASQKLEEEQEAAAELRASEAKLREEVSAMQKQLVAFQALQHDLEDERAARQKLELRLKAAVG